LGLTGRGTPDVAYNAVNYPIYDSYSVGSSTPWTVVDGTSAGAPQWSALIAIADQGRALIGKGSLANVQSSIYTIAENATKYAKDFTDITSGNNDFFGLGLGITGNQAGPGYDLASGWGTPIASSLIPDLVAINGTPIVTTSHSVASSVLLSEIVFVKPRILTDDGGSSEGLAAMSIDSIVDSTFAPAADNLESDQFLMSDTKGDSAVEQTVSLRFDDIAPLQFASDAPGDSGDLLHLSHGVHDTSADNADAALDEVFAEI
jgi:hypothetical protein